MNTEGSTGETGLLPGNDAGSSIVEQSFNFVGGRKNILFCILLFLLVAVTYLPAIRNGFVNYDDPVYVTENRHVTGGLTWDSVRWAFTNLSAGFWHPLTWLSHMLDCQLFGLRPWGHHLSSLMLHLANTLLLFLLLARLTRATWRSAVVAALFALHPLHVESAAWVAERKDVLSTLFWMLTMLAYVAYVEKSRVRSPKSKVFYALALLFFACGLMSKTMVVTLPVIMLLLDYWPLNRFAPNGSRFTIARLIWEKLPFFVLAVAAGLLTLHAESTVGAVSISTQRSITTLTSNAVLSCWYYLWQMVWPANLAVFYPFPDSFSLSLTIVAGAALLGISVVAVVLMRRRPYLAVGWFWYLITLLPVSGLVQVGSHARADRYTYVPLIGMFMLLTWGAYELTRRWRNQTTILSFAAGVVVFICIALTRQQIGCWKSGETLFRHAIAVTRGNYIAHINLGDELRKQGLYDEALSQYREALSLKPNNALAHYGFGIALDRKGLVDEAISQYLHALKLKPDYAEVHNSLGVALRKKDHFDEAMSCFQEALRLQPDLAEAHNNMGFMLERKGQLDEAILQYEQALKLKPDDSKVCNDLGVALGRKGRLDEAIGQLQRAMSLDPNSADIHYNLGNALARNRQLDEAIIQLQESLKLDATSADVHHNLGVVLTGRGRLDEAIAQFQEAIRLKPDYAEAHTNLATVQRMKDASAKQPTNSQTP